jgi:hypothetical protein
LEYFSVFVTSLEAMQELSGSSDGFGGDLRHGGATTGLEGADNICTAIAEKSMPGSGVKQWRAFLSTAAGGPDDGPVHAKDRIGAGPWYDRMGRLVAMNINDLLQERPEGADAFIADNLPNEDGVPNRTSEDLDNHDIITATNEDGEYDDGDTCQDWTYAPPLDDEGGPAFGGPLMGHSWPSNNSGASWIAAHSVGGCAPSVNLEQTGGSQGNGIGSGGGYGGIYCFALTP